VIYTYIPINTDGNMFPDTIFLILQTTAPYSRLIVFWIDSLKKKKSIGSTCLKANTEARQRWGMLFSPELGRQKQPDLWVWGQPGLQATQRNLVLKKQKQQKQKQKQNERQCETAFHSQRKWTIRRCGAALVLQHKNGPTILQSESLDWEDVTQSCQPVTGKLAPQGQTC
jgi:hypothetical protein